MQFIVQITQNEITCFRAIGERLLSRYRNDKVALKDLRDRIKDKQQQHKQEREEVIKQIEEHHLVSYKIS